MLIDHPGARALDSPSAHNDEAEDATMQEVNSSVFTSAQISDMAQTINPLLLSTPPTNVLSASESIPISPDKESSSPTMSITQTPPPIPSPPITENPPPKQPRPITKPQLQLQARPLVTAKPPAKSASTPRTLPLDNPSEIPPIAPGGDEDSYQVEEVEDDLMSDQEGDDTGSTISH